MTRMWNVAPWLLCDQHLLGEHKEMHQIAGTIAKHPHGAAIARGHAVKGQVDTSLIQTRHDELAAEMERRQFAHRSDLTYRDELSVGTVDPDANRMELAEHCADCRERMRRVNHALRAQR